MSESMFKLFNLNIISLFLFTSESHQQLFAYVRLRVSRSCGRKQISLVTKLLCDL